MASEQQLIDDLIKNYQDSRRILSARFESFNNLVANNKLDQELVLAESEKINKELRRIERQFKKDYNSLFPKVNNNKITFKNKPQVVKNEKIVKREQQCPVGTTIKFNLDICISGIVFILIFALILSTFY